MIKYNEGGFVAKEGNMKNKEIRKQSEFILYKSPDGQIKVDVYFQDETIWLTQKRMAELFEVGVNTINYHLKEIYKCNELQEVATIRKIRIVQKEGNREVVRNVDFYNLDAIISIGYRVNSLALLATVYTVVD